MEHEAVDGAEFDASFVPRLREEVAFVPVKDEGLLYVERTGALHQLDATGALVASLLDGESSVEGLATSLAGSFGADRERVEQDVLTFVRMLGDASLLAGVDGDETDPADAADVPERS